MAETVELTGVVSTQPIVLNGVTGAQQITMTGTVAQRGPAGADGVGIPTGGVSGDVLFKSSSVNYATIFRSIQLSDVVGLVDALASVNSYVDWLYINLAANPEEMMFGTITRNEYGSITGAPVIWPDGSTGTYTALTTSTSPPGAVNSYTVTHDERGITYTQPAVTRGTDGYVTNRPEITEDSYFFSRLEDPDRTEVYDSEGGTKLAVFTDGAKSVHLYRTDRTFTEQKAPFTDTFARTRSNAWGASPGGGNWDAFGGVDLDSEYNVSGGVGTIEPTTTGTSRYMRLNDIVGQFDAETSFSIDTPPAGASNSMSLIGGFQTTSNHMRFRLTINDSGTIVASISEVVATTDTVIATAGTIHTGYTGGDIWHVRGVFDGTDTYDMYAWKDGDPEPGSPTVTATSTLYPTGKLGVRVLASASSTNNPTFSFYDFSATALWPDPPSVTHNVWVRVLPEPFDGVVDVAWLTANLASSSTTNEVLAVAMKYITGGASDSHYGPLDTDGTRIEGADWNDFSGETGNYPNLVVPTTDPPEVAELGCLDCSGYVRRVFGDELGLPMCLSSSADFNGLNIPRTSVNQADVGVGVVLFSEASGDVTSDQIATLLPGDVPFFDADPSDEQEGQIDHNGIYIGVDSNGEHRFVSSRKTANGPTFGDLGGPSTITGSGLYGRTLRKARRY